MELFVDIVGWIGSIALTIAYVMISRGKLTAQTYLYQGLNLLGSICLIINSTYYGAYPSTALNIVWVGIGVFALYNIAKISRKEAEALEQVSTIGKDEEVPGSKS
ncbi:MAG: hypothetical protein R8P61_03680 [Bacteroidia bacterium]|nr:hypothetical protein [Bacteroidia bacterium]